MPALNLCNWDDSVTAGLKKVLATLLPQFQSIEVSINSLNEAPVLFGPLQNAVTSELSRGLLQLPQGSQILADETKMSTGQLKEIGLRNLRTISCLAKLREIPYCLHLGPLNYFNDARLLILSRTPSLVGNRLALPWFAQVSTHNGRFIIDEPSILSVARRYIFEAARTGKDYIMQEELSKACHRDYNQLNYASVLIKHCVVFLDH